MFKKIFAILLLCSSCVCAADVEVSSIERVKDGDTLILWYRQVFVPENGVRIIVEKRATVRFVGLDTWEKGRRKPYNEKGVKAEEYLKQLLVSRRVRLITDWQWDSFGRLLGKLIRYDHPTGQWQSINRLMRDAGHADSGSKWNDPSLD